MAYVSQIVLKDANGNVIGTYNVKDASVPHDSKTASSGGNTLSLVTTGEKYSWDNKSISNLKDTTISSATNNDRLTYSNGKWVNENSVWVNNGKNITILNANSKGVLSAYNSSGGRISIYNNNNTPTETITLTGSNGNVKCTTVNSYHPISCTFGNDTKTFTSSTTLTYTGKSVSCPAGRRKLVRAWFRYVNSAPVEYAVSTANNSLGSYFSACIAYGKDGGYGCPCLTFVVNGGETLYYFARYTSAASNRIDETSIEYFTL